VNDYPYKEPERGWWSSCGNPGPRPDNICQETGFLWKLTCNAHELSGQNQLPLSDREACTFVVNEINAFAVRVCKSDTPRDTPSYRYAETWLLATHLQCHDAAYVIAHARKAKKSSMEKRSFASLIPS